MISKSVSASSVYPVLLDMQNEWRGADTHVAQLLWGAAHAVHLDDAVVPPQRRLGVVVVPRFQRPGRNIVDHQFLASENLEMSGKPCNRGYLGEAQMHI